MDFGGIGRRGNGGDVEWRRRRGEKGIGSRVASERWGRFGWAGSGPVVTFPWFALLTVSTVSERERE
jgi:hypothetical protein